MKLQEIKIQVKDLFAKGVRLGMTPEQVCELFKESIREVTGDFFLPRKMEILHITHKDANEVLKKVKEEISKEIAVVNISYFYCNVDENNHAVISFYN